MRRLTSRLGALVGLLVPLLLPLPAFAHAFGQQYTLPLPISFYTGGASIALIASFVILSFFSHPKKARSALERSYRLPGWLRSRALAVALRIFGVAVFASAISTGFFGSGEIAKNPSLFLFWIGLLLATPYASAVVAGLWQHVDPFRTLVELVLGKNYPPILVRPPAWLAYVPAVAFFYFVLWLELASYGAGAVPSYIAAALIGYLMLTFFGVALFGNDAWFREGDFFSVFFGVFERFAPFSLADGRVRASPPGERLIVEKAESTGLLLFILLMLSSTAYDGLHDTQPWLSFFASHAFLTEHYHAVSIALLILSPFVFFAFYALAVALMRLIVGYGGYRTLLLRFAFSLIPIAVAYHVAHYFSLVVSETQNLIPMLSDPLGRGLDLFGTASYVYNPGLIGARAVWYTQIAVIVIGHIIATYIAHRIALREFSSRSHVILSQVPMLLLMVLYTSFGLWILSLPYGV